MAIHELRAKRATAFDAYQAFGKKKPFDLTKDQPEFDRLGKEVEEIDAEIKRETSMQELSAKSAKVVEGQDEHRVFASAKNDIYTHKEAAEARGLQTNKGLVVGGIARMLSHRDPIKCAIDWYGEGHLVTRSLIAGVGASGGFIIPPEYINEIIELLRASAVVRASNPRVMPMPRGTMTLPAQTGAATASYSGEISRIPTTQQTLGQIVASYKKLTALVPVSNDLMRFSDPAADAVVRDDLVKVIALREDLAFLFGDGSANTPRGMTSFANEYALQQGGTQGNWIAAGGGNSTMAVGGNFITSTAVFTLATVASELGGLVNRLDTANVPDDRRVWFMHPRSYNYLYNVQNSLGLYVYRDELMAGKLINYPVKKSTQFPINLNDATSGNTTCSFVILTEMTDAMILDSMSLELFVSREGTYLDANGTTVSLVQTDQTLIRGIAEHDFQMRHPASVAVDQAVLWAPAIS